ncbi:hypothetical protein AMECASPLE_030084 [Ameca splendens]|uniref:Uncharacterized protein n=1 Tax=Ameca splendens TaxID=208324 RepID=A0ABV0XUW4_9TELE
MLLLHSITAYYRQAECIQTISGWSVCFPFIEAEGPRKEDFFPSSLAFFTKGQSFSLASLSSRESTSMMVIEKKFGDVFIVYRLTLHSGVWCADGSIFHCSGQYFPVFSLTHSSLSSSIVKDLSYVSPNKSFTCNID